MPIFKGNFYLLSTLDRNRIVNPVLSFDSILNLKNTPFWAYPIENLGLTQGGTPLAISYSCQADRLGTVP